MKEFTDSRRCVIDLEACRKTSADPRRTKHHHTFPSQYVLSIGIHLQDHCIPHDFAYAKNKILDAGAHATSVAGASSTINRCASAPPAVKMTSPLTAGSWACSSRNLEYHARCAYRFRAPFHHVAAGVRIYGPSAETKTGKLQKAKQTRLDDLVPENGRTERRHDKPERVRIFRYLKRLNA